MAAQVFPEWIQEQLDKLQQKGSNQQSGDLYLVDLSRMESRLLRYITARLDRIEAKIDLLIMLHQRR